MENNISDHLKKPEDVFVHMQKLYYYIIQLQKQFQDFSSQYVKSRNEIELGRRHLDELLDSVADLKKQSVQASHKPLLQVNELESRVEKQDQVLKMIQRTMNSGFQYPNSGSEIYSDDRVTQLDSKIAELERSSAMLKVHISELELQLQASLASTYNGAFLWRIPDVRRRKRDAIDGKITSIYSPPIYTGRNGYKMCI